MPILHDAETDTITYYDFFIEGVRVDFNDSWHPGASVSLYRASGKRELLYTTIDCPKLLLWTPPPPEYLQDGVEIEYMVDGYMCQEVLATEGEAGEIASRAVYDGPPNVAHIAITHALSIGTSTVWIKVERDHWYDSLKRFDVHFRVEFASKGDCTRFLHEDMRGLENRPISAVEDVSVIGDIMRTLLPIHDNVSSAERKAARHCIPFSQFQDEYPEPETQLIRHRGSNPDDDRPCYLTLHVSAYHFIFDVDWSATTIPPTFPSRLSTFQSLQSLHLKFPSSASQDRNLDASSQSCQEDLTITISAREISFSTCTSSVSLGSGFTLNSEHRTVNVNYINAIMGDAFLGTINGGNVGGRSNVQNTFGMGLNEGASTWPSVPSEPPPARNSKSISTLIRSFVRAIRFGPPRAS